MGPHYLSHIWPYPTHCTQLENNCMHFFQLIIDYWAHLMPTRGPFIPSRVLTPCSVRDMLGPFRAHNWVSLMGPPGLCKLPPVIFTCIFKSTKKWGHDKICFNLFTLSKKKKTFCLFFFYLFDFKILKFQISHFSPS